MRGDSLRDFYAKTLALTGLGMLAVVGALVDSWPGSPALASVPAPAAVGSELALLAPNPVPDRLEPVPVRPRSNTRAAMPTTVADSPGEAPLPIEPTPSVSQELAAFVPDPSLSVTPALEVAGAEIPLYEPVDSVPEILAEAVAMPPAPVASAAHSGSDDGFITGAFKRTGSSIIKGGAKTGASVVDVFRILTGAVRRALPD